MKLQVLREEKSLTIEELGEKANVAISTITAIEEGRVKPSEVTGNKLAKVLQVRPDQIDEILESVHQSWEGREGYLGPR